VRACVAGAVLFALLLNLGFWQLGRADEKNVLQTRWEARSALPAVTPLALLETSDVRVASSHALGTVADV